MCKTLLIIFMLSLASLGQAQKDTIVISFKTKQSEYQLKIDTVIRDILVGFDPAYLVGSDYFRSSPNQLDARQFNIGLDSIHVSECINGDWKDTSAVYTLVETDSSIVVEVFEVANCCHSYLCDIGVENDSTLNLIFYEYGTNHCACNCAFFISYYLQKDFFGKDEEGRYSTPTYIVINGVMGSEVKINNFRNYELRMKYYRYLDKYKWK